MGFKVLIADSAIADLGEIVEFVSRDNPEAAARLGEKLIAQASGLGVMPTRFPFHDRRRGIRKLTLAPYLVFYTCDETALVVNILHFWHGARRTPSFGV
jgi:plasmid stabilization system protein ParE